MSPSTTAWLRQCASLSEEPQESDGLNKAFFVSVASDEQLVELLGFDQAPPERPTHTSAASLTPPTAKTGAAYIHAAAWSQIWGDELLNQDGNECAATGKPAAAGGDKNACHQRVEKDGGTSQPSSVDRPNSPLHRGTRGSDGIASVRYKSTSTGSSKASTEKAAEMEEHVPKLERWPRGAIRPSLSSLSSVKQQGLSKMQESLREASASSSTQHPPQVTTDASLRRNEAPAFSANMLAAADKAGVSRSKGASKHPESFTGRQRTKVRATRAACDPIKGTKPSDSHEAALDSQKQRLLETRAHVHRSTRLSAAMKTLSPQWDERGDDARMTPSTDVSSLSIKSPQDGTTPHPASKATRQAMYPRPSPTDLHEGAKLTSHEYESVDCFTKALPQVARIRSHEAFSALTTAASIEASPSTSEELRFTQAVVEENLPLTQASCGVILAEKRCRLSLCADASLDDTTRLRASALPPAGSTPPSSAATFFTQSTNSSHSASPASKSFNKTLQPRCLIKAKVLQQQPAELIHAQLKHLPIEALKSLPTWHPHKTMSGFSAPEGFFEHNCRQEQPFCKRRGLQPRPRVHESDSPTGGRNCTDYRLDRCQCKKRNAEESLHSQDVKCCSWDSAMSCHNFDKSRQVDGGSPLPASALPPQGVHLALLHENAKPFPESHQSNAQACSPKIHLESSTFCSCPPEVRKGPHNDPDSTSRDAPLSQRYSRHSYEQVNEFAGREVVSTILATSVRDLTFSELARACVFKSISPLGSEKAAASVQAEASPTFSPPEGSERVSTSRLLLHVEVLCVVLTRSISVCEIFSLDVPRAHSAFAQVRLLQRRISLLLGRYTSHEFAKEKHWPTSGSKERTCDLALPESHEEHEEADVASVAEGVYSSLARRRTLKKVVLALARYASTCGKWRKLAEAVQKTSKLQLSNQLVAVAARYRLTTAIKEPGARGCPPHREML
ncbi:hypothetical protein ACSSS7_006739 [Eimeria intestinalis]